MIESRRLSDRVGVCIWEDSGVASVWNNLLVYCSWVNHRFYRGWNKSPTKHDLTNAWCIFFCKGMRLILKRKFDTTAFTKSRKETGLLKSAFWSSVSWHIPWKQPGLCEWPSLWQTLGGCRRAPVPRYSAATVHRVAGWMPGATHRRSSDTAAGSHTYCSTLLWCWKMDRQNSRS